MYGKNEKNDCVNMLFKVFFGTKCTFYFVFILFYFLYFYPFVSGVCLKHLSIYLSIYLKALFEHDNIVVIAILLLAPS